MTKVAAELVIRLIRIYQLTVSRVLPPMCRFQPSCSVYIVQALQTYGLLRGLLLGTRRVVRCHPFCPGGDDPLPLSDGSATTPHRN